MLGAKKGCLGFILPALSPMQALAQLPLLPEEEKWEILSVEIKTIE